jgi:hypothetical protein
MKNKKVKDKQLDDQYLQYAAQLSSILGAQMSSTLGEMPLEYKFKIGAIALSSLIADFCYAIINKEHPDLSKKLIDDIAKQAHIILQSRCTGMTKQ